MLRRPAHRVSERAVVWWTVRSLAGWLAVLVPAAVAVRVVPWLPSGSRLALDFR